MGFVFDGRNRLVTGVDGFLELRDPLATLGQVDRSLGEDDRSGTD
jgi:hypothetical protein